MDPHDVLAALTAMQLHTHDTRDACTRIARWLEALNQPAIPETVALTALEPIKHLEHGISARSIAVYNPSPITVQLGFGGGRARADARAWSVPAAAALVLPIVVEDTEVGADPTDLAGGDAFVFVLRFPTVQPFFFGALGA